MKKLKHAVWLIAAAAAMYSWPSVILFALSGRFDARIPVTLLNSALSERNFLLFFTMLVLLSAATLAAFLAGYLLLSGLSETIAEQQAAARERKKWENEKKRKG